MRPPLVRRRRATSAWIALLVALVVLVSSCSGDTSVAPPPPPGDSTADRVAAAQRTMDGLAAALTSRDPEAAAELGGAAAQEALRTAVDNAGLLDLGELSFRVVDDAATLSGADRERHGSEAWAASVELGYRLAGWDARTTRVETRVVFEDSGDRATILALGGGDGRTPLWLSGPVERHESGRVLVIAHDPAQRLVDLGRRAVTVVGRVLPDWRGRLVVEVPADGRGLAGLLAAPEARYANIAAVTASVDGTLVPGAPVHVFVNPDVFDTLGPRGAQVVMSHETTHVATDATFADVPTWLLEGFADYVALAHAGIPVSRAASQALGRIRKQGLPEGLPTAAELDPSASGLGATYELAWLAARSIAEQHGEDDLVAFYRRVSAGTDVATAFREVLGTTEAAFVDRWRDELRTLSGSVAG